jgi:hypothetical protein
MIEACEACVVVQVVCGCLGCASTGAAAASMKLLALAAAWALEQSDIAVESGQCVSCVGAPLQIAHSKSAHPL